MTTIQQTNSTTSPRVDHSGDDQALSKPGERAEKFEPLESGTTAKILSSQRRSTGTKLVSGFRTKNLGEASNEAISCALKSKNKEPADEQKMWGAIEQHQSELSSDHNLPARLAYAKKTRALLTAMGLDSTSKEIDVLDKAIARAEGGRGKTDDNENPISSSPRTRQTMTASQAKKIEVASYLDEASLRLSACRELDPHPEAKKLIEDAIKNLRPTPEKEVNWEGLKNLESLFNEMVDQAQDINSVHVSLDQISLTELRLGDRKSIQKSIDELKSRATLSKGLLGDGERTKIIEDARALIKASNESKLNSSLDKKSNEVKEAFKNINVDSAVEESIRKAIENLRPTPGKEVDWSTMREQLNDLNDWIENQLGGSLGTKLNGQDDQIHKAQGLMNSSKMAINAVLPVAKDIEGVDKSLIEDIERHRDDFPLITKLDISLKYAKETESLLDRLGMPSAELTKLKEEISRVQPGSVATGGQLKAKKKVRFEAIPDKAEQPPEVLNGRGLRAWHARKASQDAKTKVTEASATEEPQAVQQVREAQAASAFVEGATAFLDHASDEVEKAPDDIGNNINIKTDVRKMIGELRKSLQSMRNTQKMTNSGVIDQQLGTLDELLAQLQIAGQAPAPHPFVKPTPQQGSESVEDAVKDYQQKLQQQKLDDLKQQYENAQEAMWLNDLRTQLQMLVEFHKEMNRVAAQAI